MEGEEDKREQRREKEGKGAEKEDGARERENEQEEDTSGQERIEGSQGKVRDPAPSTTASTPVKPVPREHARVDWATDIDESIGPVPTPSDFRPTKPLSPSASPNPTPRPHANLVMPAQPVCAPPKPTVTQRNGDVAPRAPTPATGTPTAPTSVHVTERTVGPHAPLLPSEPQTGVFEPSARSHDNLTTYRGIPSP